jgi:hypothetical protein
MDRSMWVVTKTLVPHGPRGRCAPGVRAARLPWHQKPPCTHAAAPESRARLENSLAAWPDSFTLRHIKDHRGD